MVKKKSLLCSDHRASPEGNKPLNAFVSTLPM